MYQITIDGPSSSGKSTVASLVAKKLGIVHANTGEAYRAIAYCLLNKGVDTSDVEGIKRELENNSFKMLYQNGKYVLLINGEDVTERLHSNQVNAVVSHYGNHAPVIYKASDMAREAIKGMSVVMEGRNLGSFCFTDAKYKFYVDCEAKERAKRRYYEMQEKGFDVDFETIHKQTVERDRLDKTRPVAPLIVPEGAVLLDSTHCSAECVAEKIANIVKSSEQSYGL